MFRSNKPNQAAFHCKVTHKDHLSFCYCQDKKKKNFFEESLKRKAYRAACQQSFILLGYYF